MYVCERGPPALATSLTVVSKCRCRRRVEISLWCVSPVPAVAKVPAAQQGGMLGLTVPPGCNHFQAHWGKGEALSALSNPVLPWGGSPQHSIDGY